MKLEVGMSKELKLLFEDLHKNELSKVGKCNLELEIRNLIKQLQAYKDKEDRLREYCNEQGKDMTKLESIFTGEETKEYVLLNGFLQILNEGDK